MSGDDALMRLINAAEAHLEDLQHVLRQCSFEEGRSVWRKAIAELEEAIRQVKP